ACASKLKPASRNKPPIRRRPLLAAAARCPIARIDPTVISGRRMPTGSPLRICESWLTMDILRLLGGPRHPPVVLQSQVISAAARLDAELRRHYSNAAFRQVP